jgi:hypothetical protein
VAGNGAILESTQTLGPAFKVTESHKTGDHHLDHGIGRSKF